MVEIINPEFKRSVKQKLRMLKAKPELSRLPEFKTEPPKVWGFVIFVAAVLAPSPMRFG